MGKKKIQIKKIMDPKTQITTFSRRRNGLLKKAYELSVLCGIDVTILIFDEKNKCHVYCSNEKENAAEIMMQKYIDRRFKTDTSKKHSESIGLECQLDKTIHENDGYNLNDRNESVAIVQTYQVMRNDNQKKGTSLSYIPSEECLDETDKTEGLYVKSKRTYHVYTESPKKEVETEYRRSDSYFLEQFQNEFIDQYQNNNLQSDYTNHTQSTANSNNTFFQSYPYTYMMNNNCNFGKSVPNLRMFSSLENISQNSAPMVHNNRISPIYNYLHQKSPELLLFNSLKKFNNQLSSDFEINNQSESNMLNNIMQEPYKEVTSNPLSPNDEKYNIPNGILTDFQNHLYIYD
ncbi:hypothetical protein T552_02196 [Pneumocystis carinii B80]|uniref:MADS-box domain-containing protein n=1 Tax=Pneumocystis carinii (strain B80) TaxID=1408658 RepID=A0A0W4ZHB1_PNEC8|nr:hypothetical protein T552_02196 [Pneumocystis carinii B80]KTW27756.1 hypothetical protein T552_02196 [Pneumocystis carinii B80]